MPFIRRLVQGTDFRRFLDFVTPAFFEVMPAGDLFRIARSLVRDYRSESKFRSVLQHRCERLRTAGFDIRGPQSATRPPRPLGQLPEEARAAVGQAILNVYFHQIYDDGPTLLNLSADRFGYDEGRVLWWAGPGHIDWPADFRAPLRNIYTAFYADGPLSLRQALEPLNLHPAEDIFRRHFGSGDQRAVRFQVETFVGAFHDVFIVCKNEGIRLHPAFLALGIYLASLYEALEAVGLPLDVRGAYEKAGPGILEPTA